jgi:hypothetical protein
MSLTTKNKDYSIFRAFGTEDAASLITALATSTSLGDFANKSATAFKLPDSDYPDTSAANAVEIIFGGTNAENETFSFGIFGYANNNGPAELICTGTGILGAQDIVKYPETAVAVTGWWADTLVVTSYHPTTIIVADSGNDRVAKLCFDTIGYKYLKCYIYDADGTTGVEALTVGAYIRWY